MPSIMTVLGPIDPAELGPTYAHEHLLGAPPEWSAEREEQDFSLLSMDAARAELALFKQAGGRAIVEMSPPDYNRQPVGLRDLARATGVHIIMVTGLHKDAFSRPLTAGATVDQLAERFASDVRDGAEGTGVRAGVIKAATSLNTITAGEEKALRAAARAHLATGAPVSTHTQAGTMGLEQLDILAREGVDPARVAIGHVDRKLDYEYHTALLNRGAYVIFDQISKEKYALDRERVALLRRLVDAGYGERVMLSGDFARRSAWTSNSGGPGLTYILWRFAPWLREEGLPAEAVANFLIHNPRRFFAF